MSPTSPTPSGSRRRRLWELLHENGVLGRELAKAQEEWQSRLDACPEEHRPYLVLQYATPVRNQYRVKAGLAL